MKVNIGPYTTDNKQRKIKVEIENFDLYSADYTLSLIIAPVLRGLQKCKAGSPDVDDEDVPAKIRNRSKKPWTIKSDKNFHKRWDYVLGEMVFVFNTLEEAAIHDKDISVKFFNNGQLDIKGLKKFNARMDNGLRLFAKYYRCLWT